MQGADEAVRKLDRLANPRFARNAGRRASRRAMNVVRDAARANAKAIDDPETVDKIWKNISVQSGKSRNPNEIVMRVGVRGGASFSNPNPPKTSGGDTRHWRFIELGTSEIAPIPFMRNALSQNIDRVTKEFIESFNLELDKELAKR